MRSCTFCATGALALILSSVASAAQLTDGYVSRSSFDAGDTIDMYLSGPEEDNATLSIYSTSSLPYDRIQVDLRPQAPPEVEPWMGYNYDVTHQYHLPVDMQSAVYRIKGGVRFIVRDPDKTSDVVVVHPTNTINAYSKSGDVNLYGTNKAQTVAIDRPQKESTMTVRFDNWLASSKFDYRYLADYDVEDYSQLQGSKLMILTGAAEYWSRRQRENFDRFIDEGGNVLVLAGNTMHRPVEFDETGQHMTELREHSKYKGKWDDAYLDYPTVDSIAGDFYWGGYGWLEGDRADLGWDGWKIADEDAPFLEGLGLSEGDIVSNLTNEYDAPPMTGFDENGVPQIDNEALGLHYINLIGWDRSNSNFRGTDGYGGWYEFQRTPESGRVIVVGSNLWTRNNQPLARRLDEAMMDYLLAWDGTQDFDHDGLIGASDIDYLTKRIRGASHDPLFDIDGNGTVNMDDRVAFIHDTLGSRAGDSNLDGKFSSADFVVVFEMGKYDAMDGQSTWESGDWTGDGNFTSADIVAAFIVGDYESDVDVAFVPEPQTLPLTTLLVMLGLCRGRVTSRQAKGTLTRGVKRPGA